ncbi:aldehyde dehydrogenase domain-containing protein [Lipomyces japonicus]|uniref:aldehyde dehydrogenase domain-containing protein n=1 Tax=Lipomyces japonicus TaxID=56871 RepID=UPI0034CE68EB
MLARCSSFLNSQRLAFSTSASVENLSCKLVTPNGLSYSQPTGLFINNAFIKSSTSFNELLTAECPATASQIAQVESASSSDIDLAVNVARAAYYGEWNHTNGTERGQLLLKLSSLISESRHLLASVEAWDSGRPFTIAQTEDVQDIVNVSRYYAGWSDKALVGRTQEQDLNRFSYTVRESLGVCGLIVPWNYPLMIAMWKLAPAVAAGNTVILKPAPETSLSTLLLGDLIRQAGFPPGVINILPGDKSVGRELTLHKGINKISFTGSTSTGKQVLMSAAQNLVPVSIELGGKSAAIVFDDADLANAVNWSIFGCFGNSGQMCSATGRIFVHERIYDEFIGKFIKAIHETIKMGLPFESTTTHGPLISASQQKKVLMFINSAMTDRAELLFKGNSILFSSGYFVEPTVFGNVSDDMVVAKEEIFGPVALISKFATDDEVIQRVNSTMYGLASAVFTSNMSKAISMSKKLKSGTIYLNCSNDTDFRIPFGGYKASGNSTSRDLGLEGIESYTQVKSVLMKVS